MTATVTPAAALRLEDVRAAARALGSLPPEDGDDWIEVACGDIGHLAQGRTVLARRHPRGHEAVEWEVACDCSTEDVANYYARLAAEVDGLGELAVPTNGNGGSPVSMVGDHATATALSSIRREAIKWLPSRIAPNRIPLGMLTLGIGHPGLGKSTLTADLAAETSAAGGNVLMLTAEDSPPITVRPRIEAAEGDPERVRIVEMVRDGLPDGLAFPDDAAELDRLVVEHQARLVVIDPWMAHLPESVNSFRDQSMRRASAPLHRIAAERGCSIFLVAHLNKGQGTDALMRTGGSIGLPAAVRSALLLARDPDDPDGDEGRRRVLAHVKCNVGRQQPPLSLELEPVLLPGDDRIETVRLRSLGESSASTADLLAGQYDDERTTTDEAVDFLRAELADGPRLASEVQTEARRAALTDKTIRVAREKLGIKPAKTGFEGGWEWALPEDALNPDQDRAPSPTGERGHLRAVPLPERDSGQPEPPDPAQDALSPDMGILGSDGTCSCRLPARSPRADGSDLCRSCRKPIEAAAENRCGQCGAPVLADEHRERRCWNGHVPTTGRRPA